MKKLIFFLLALSQVAVASEIDSFSRRYEPLEDSSPIINKNANRFLKEAAERANGISSCNEVDLFKEIRKDYNIILRKGNFINYIVQSPEVPKHTIARKESIFKYHKITDGYLLARPAADMDGIGMGTTMNFNGVYIGSDKFEHMFGQGYHYYRRFYKKGYSLKRVLLIGNVNERLHLGGNRIATGVYTFADLVANFQGMRFYNHILQKKEDLLGENLGPYLECQEGKWVQVKEVDFRNYIDEAFDEGINCAAVITKHGHQGVKKALAELAEKDPSNVYTCPVDSARLQQVKGRYNLPIGGFFFKKNLIDYIFNPWDEMTQYKPGWILW
jgi:hypothetical protein